VPLHPPRLTHWGHFCTHDGCGDRNGPTCAAYPTRSRPTSLENCVLWLQCLADTDCSGTTPKCDTSNVCVAVGSVSLLCYNCSISFVGIIGVAFTGPFVSGVVWLLFHNQNLRLNRVHEHHTWSWIRQLHRVGLDCIYAGSAVPGSTRCKVLTGGYGVPTCPKVVQRTVSASNQRCPYTSNTAFADVSRCYKPCYLCPNHH
jgi:hypothetical protein